jgi:hypothetical protein
MELLLDESGKLVGPQYFEGNMCGASDFTKTLTASAKTSKRLGHVPLGGWIKEGHLIALCNLFQCNYFHRMRIKKHIRITAMIDVLQMLWV